MTELAYSLNEPVREIAKRTIQEVCEYRMWTLLALHARSTHIHVVADVDCEPDRAIRDFKAHITRHVRENGLDAGRKSFRAQGGSTVRLGNPDAVENAVVYVLEKQGAPMTTYLNPKWRR